MGNIRWQNSFQLFSKIHIFIIALRNQRVREDREVMSASKDPKLSESEDLKLSEGEDRK